MICDSSISDGGWGMACYNAMIDAARKYGWETEVSDSIEQSAYYDNIVSYCELGYDMIYAPGNQYTDAVLQAAEEFPDISFALLNGAPDTPEKAVNKNVTSLLPDAQQIGWIAGAMAGLMTESNTVAFIGGMELDTTKAKYQGFAEAAAFVGKDEGKAVDSGARQAIDEANSAVGAVKVYDIAQPSDLLGQNECIITSQVTDNSSLVGLCMEDVQKGRLGGGVIYGTLQNDVLRPGKISDLVPKDKQDKYAAYIQQMYHFYE